MADDRSRPPATRGPARVAALVLRDNLRFRKRIERAYRRAIGQAQREIVIANAYFVPGVALQRALLRAARARRARSRCCCRAATSTSCSTTPPRRSTACCCARGVEIIEYSPSFLHAKVARDRRRAGPTVGSSNLDPLSLLLAREANVVVARRRVRAPSCAATCSTRSQHDGQRGRAAAHMKRPLAQRSLAWRRATALMRFALLRDSARLLSRLRYGDR